MAILLVAMVHTEAAGAEGLTSPSLELGRTQTAIGETVVASGSGWTPGQVIQVETCGNLGLAGSIDCAVSSGVSVRVAADGSWRSPVVVATPPTPCPCVISARAGTGAEAVTAEVSIAGTVQAPVQTASPTDERRAADVRAETGGVTAEATASVMPWAMTGVVLLALGAGVLLFHQRRHAVADGRLELITVEPPTVARAPLPGADSGVPAVPPVVTRTATTSTARPSASSIPPPVLAADLHRGR